MPESAFQIQYRKEFIAGFEQRESLVRKTVTTEAEINAQIATFLVADSGGATATTRGLNGLIVYRNDNLNQYQATLQEWNDGVRRSSFNLYASQGDGRRIMQQSTMAVLNRKADSDIMAALETGTQDTGTSQPGSLALVMYALTILGNNAVPFDGNISALISPAFHAYLMQTKEFTSVDWINNKPFAGALMAYRWAGVNFIVHPNITGKATNAEKCIMYHRSAIGHACDTQAIRTDADFNREHQYSWALASAFMGSKLLQNTGVVIMNHDGSQYVAQ